MTQPNLSSWKFPTPADISMSLFRRTSGGVIARYPKLRPSSLLAALALVLALFYGLSRINSLPQANTVVVKVFDGDSILLSDGREIRYIGVDAPETGGYRPAEYYGEQSRSLNSDLVMGKIVSIVTDVETTDHYGRTLAYVFVDDTLVNEAVIREGAALARPYPPNLSYQELFCAAMKQARIEEKGMWANTDAWMIPQNDADDYIGLSKTVVGTVIASELTASGVFLNFGFDYASDFTVFIPAGDLDAFYTSGINDPALAYRGKQIEVIGTITEKNGPSIRITSPCQIHLRP